MISLRQLCKSYEVQNSTYHALRNIDLNIHKGEIFGIIGQSGAGKSTLLRSINLLEKPNTGRVFINQIDLTTLSPQDLKKQRRQIGMIFQHFNLLSSRTAYENAALPLELLHQDKMQIQKEVSALLDLVHLTDYKHHLPQQLSGGQKQRVAIARALATKPQILLCDEPTSALDPKSTASILNLLKEINCNLGVTIVIITHEMDIIKQICHRAAVLHHGELIEQGTVVDLFTSPRTSYTQQLIQKNLHLELPSMIKEKIQTTSSPNKSRLVKLTFVGQDSSHPLITILVKKFNMTINLIQANIETIQDTIIGFTVCLFSGKDEDLDQALIYIEQSSVTAEVLGYV